VRAILFTKEAKVCAFNKEHGYSSYIRAEVGDLPGCRPKSDIGLCGVGRALLVLPCLKWATEILVTIEVSAVRIVV